MSQSPTHSSLSSSSSSLAVTSTHPIHAHQEDYFSICHLQKNLISTDFGVFILNSSNLLQLEKYYLLEKKGHNAALNPMNGYLAFLYAADHEHAHLVDLSRSKYVLGGPLTQCKHTKIQLSTTEHHFTPEFTLFTKDYFIIVGRRRIEVRVLTNPTQIAAEYLLAPDTSTEPIRVIATTSEASNILAYSIVHSQEKSVSSTDAHHGNVTLVNLDHGSLSVIKMAHLSNIQCMALSRDGSLLATCSEKGTLIRVFNTDTLKKCKELRRGSGNAQMFSIAFSPDNTMICCYSSSNTVHLFSCVTQNKKSMMHGLKFISKYVDSEWSMLNAKHEQLHAPGVCWFAAQDVSEEQNEDALVTIHLMTYDGHLIAFTFDLKEKELKSSQEGSIYKLLGHVHVDILRDEIKTIRSKHPDCTPLTLTPRNSNKLKECNAPEMLKKTRVFVKKNVRLGELAYTVSKRLNLEPDKTVRFHLNCDSEDGSKEVSSGEALDIAFTVDEVEQHFLRPDELCVNLCFDIVD